METLLVLPILLSLIGIMVTLLQLARVDLLLGDAANAGVVTLASTGSQAQGTDVIRRALLSDGLNPNQVAIQCQVTGVAATVQLQTPVAMTWPMRTVTVETRRYAARSVP